MKKFKSVIVFGEMSARAYRDAEECGEKIPESELETFGSVVRREFETEAEQMAYLTALKDYDGWYGYAVAEEEFLES